MSRQTPLSLIVVVALETVLFLCCGDIVSSDFDSSVFVLVALVAIEDSTEEDSDDLHFKPSDMVKSSSSSSSHDEGVELLIVGEEELIIEAQFVSAV